jgi:hypothetical protein
MDRSQGLDSWGNYGGEDFGHVVVVAGQNRDSDILCQSNFSSALEMLGGETETVQVHRFGHWGCGWFELICVDAKDRKALVTAFEIHKQLEEYSVLDDSDYFERQNEHHTDYARGAQDDLAEALCIHFGLPEEFYEHRQMVHVAFELNMACQSYYGDDSCVNVYRMREPDAQDLDRLEVCVREIKYCCEGNQAYEYLRACLGMEE